MWMSLDNLVLREISLAKKDKYYVFSLRNWEGCEEERWLVGTWVQEK
jgi:hypothetical protein